MDNIEHNSIFELEKNCLAVNGIDYFLTPVLKIIVSKIKNNLFEQLLDKKIDLDTIHNSEFQISVILKEIKNENDA